MLIGSIGQNNNNQQPINSAVKPKNEVPDMHEIEKGLKAEGAKKIGEEAFEEAMKQLSELLEARDIDVSSSYDAKSGLRQVKLYDKKTGKTIADMPPEGVVEMAEKARQEHIGWFIDKLS